MPPSTSNNRTQRDALERRPHNHHWFPATIAAALLIAALARTITHPAPYPTTEAEAAANRHDHWPDMRININTATAAEFAALPDIGPTLAHAIIHDRATRGDFTSIEDLDRVPNIGPKTIESIRPYVITDK